MSSNNFTISTKAIYNIFHIAWIVMTCVLLIKILVTVVQPMDIGIPIYFTIHDAGDIVSHEGQKISITSAEGFLKYDDTYQPPFLTVVAYQLKSLLRIILLVFILSQVRLILKNASEQNPFDRKNSQRLLKIGWAILAIGILQILAALFAYYSFDTSNLSLNDNVDCNCSDPYIAGRKTGFILSKITLNPYLYMGLITIALSNAFKTGSSMKEEVDLTI